MKIAGKCDWEREDREYGSDDGDKQRHGMMFHGKQPSSGTAWERMNYMYNNVM